MKTGTYKLQNDGIFINNDVVLFDYPLVLNDFLYHFWIRPKQKYWRFGIRISKDTNIKFYHPEHRYKSPEFQENYIDIHLSVGEWNNEQWYFPNKLQLAQYNIIGEEHIIEKVEKYQEKGEVEWQFKKGEEDDYLEISFAALPNIRVTKRVKIGRDFKYFKVFAWADKIDFELDIQLEISYLNENIENKNNVLAIKVGNIIFREGDMFDNDSMQNTEMLFLPASSEGTASSNILNRASEIGIPFPVESNPGSVSLFKPVNESYFVAGYAYSVEKANSNEEVISKICKSIITLIEKGKQKVNIPLLGSGAGGLEPLLVSKIYDENFNNDNYDFVITVSIPDINVFDKIKESFIGRYETLKSSYLKKPLQILKLEEKIKWEINSSSFRIDEKGEIVYLNLSGCKVNILELLNFPNLEILSLNNSSIINPVLISSLINLRTLYFSNNNLIEYGFLGALKNLEVLDLSYNNIKQIDFLKPLTRLRELYLRGNNINDINALSNLTSIQILDLSDNEILDIVNLKTLNKIRNLNISKNKISSFIELINCKLLMILDISDNNISNIDFVNEFPKLEYFKGDKNPFSEIVNLKFAVNENHLPAIKNYFNRQEENQKKELLLPAKVLLLGNHSSGKSSLLNYFLSKKSAKKIESTHIIQIKKYPEEAKIPEAIFFDFGGQDYYHGIYKAFLSSGSIYLILWNKEFNNNSICVDSNGILTQNFSLQYWLSQKSYIEKEFYEGKIDPVLLIQTFADIDKRVSQDNPMGSHEILNEFYISLKNSSENENSQFSERLNIHALQYLRSSIEELIKSKQITRNEPDWYIDFISYILNNNSINDFASKSIKDDVAHFYKNEIIHKIESLKIELDQLHQQGLILYYKNELPDNVWLNPAALANYVHQEILNKKLVKDGRIPYSHLVNYNQSIIKLLLLQKVIFLHEFGDEGPEYIIPNFLPLTNEMKDSFDLFTFGFGKPEFIIKFKCFIPFGFINQIICFFGREKDKKKFWRDQVLFTIEGKAKVLIHLNFQTLEISVYVSFVNMIKDRERNNILKYIFYGIVGLYWDIEIFNFTEYSSYLNNELSINENNSKSRISNKIDQYQNLIKDSAYYPSDMYLTLDGDNYVSYSELNNDENSVSINSIILDENSNFTNKIKAIPIYPFQNFTKNSLRKRKKVAISYSKKDLEFVNKFREYLVPLFDDELIDEPWYCTELIAGREWNDEIQQKFDEADIIFFMISEKLMATKYVKENEIKNAIDKWNLNKSIKIIPILLVRYHFARKGEYDLSKFVAFPYTLQPVCEFQDQHLAWHSISESIRLMIEYDWDPGSNKGQLSSEQKAIFEKIIAGKA